LAYTSAALSYALTEFGKPVVVTGALVAVLPQVVDNSAPIIGSGVGRINEMLETLSLETHILYTGGTLGMVSTPDGLAPGADLTGWLTQLLSARNHIVEQVRLDLVTHRVPPGDHGYCDNGEQG
jgi:L-asparaginase/Glu-tRNA(Gln) amidotransferase subunit D